MNRWLRLALLAALAACAALPPPGLDGADAASLPQEAASGSSVKPGWSARRFAVAAANPLATDAGYQVLKAGGSAIDAAIAVQMVLTLVEPQASGIGGGAFILHWDGAQVEAFDGRETAPALADERLFLQGDGQPMPFERRRWSAVARSACPAPCACSRWRTRDTASCRGRACSSRPSRWPSRASRSARVCIDCCSVERSLPLQPQAAAYLLRRQRRRRGRGARACATPRSPRCCAPVAERGSDAFYRGPIAQDLVRRVRAFPGNPGRLSEADLAAYRPQLREALCDDWKARWRVCGFPPPSSGHLALMQMLKLIEFSPRRVRAAARAGCRRRRGCTCYTEAARLAFADRSQYVADPAFVQPAGVAAGAACSTTPTCVSGLRRSGRRACIPRQPGVPAAQPRRVRAAARTARGTAPATCRSSTAKAARSR